MNFIPSLSVWDILITFEDMKLTGLCHVWILPKEISEDSINDNLVPFNTGM